MKNISLAQHSNDISSTKDYSNVMNTFINQNTPSSIIPNHLKSPPMQVDKKQIIVVFLSSDQIIQNYRVTCYNTDIVETIKEKIYLINPEFKHKTFYFLANGNIINERLSLAENKIEDETYILIQEF